MPQTKQSLIVASLLAALACGGGGAADEAADGAETGVPAAEIAAGIGAETLLDVTATLASDAFEGRAPGSEGETKTVAYLTEQFSGLGLTPGNPDGTWVQAVPLVGITPLPGDGLVVSRDGNVRTLEPAADYVGWAPRGRWSSTRWGRPAIRGRWSAARRTPSRSTWWPPTTT